MNNHYILYHKTRRTRSQHWNLSFRDVRYMITPNLIGSPCKASSSDVIINYGSIKFMGKIKRDSTTDDGDVDSENCEDAAAVSSLVGEISISSLKLNQLILAPQLAGRLSVSRDHVKVITWFSCFWCIISMSNTSSISSNRPLFGNKRIVINTRTLIVVKAILSKLCQCVSSI